MIRDTLWTSAEAGNATGGQSSFDWTASGVSIDSRSLAGDELFVAIKGPRVDGHDYVAAAFAAGASAAMIHKDISDLPPGAPVLRVDDTQAGLEALGASSRARVGARVIAVTGSVGKTGTKEALRQVLSDQGPTHASAGSLNNLWGVPLSMARMPRDTVYGVFELGMNHAGELTPLSKQVRPHVALITNVEAVHLGHFASVEAIAEAKAEIFAGVEEGGVAVLNRDNPHFDYLAGQAKAAGIERIVGFGQHADADACITKFKVHPDCTCVVAQIDGQPVTYKVGISGAHWALNSVGVLAAVVAAGGDLGRAALSLAGLKPLKGRGERHVVHCPGGDFTLVDESYNASPVAMRAAFDVLAHLEPEKQGRRIAVLGDMLELGDDAPKLHAELADDVVAAGTDIVFCAGPNMQALHDTLPAKLRGAHTADSDALHSAVIGEVRPGDVVLVKGSLGSRMGPIVEALMALGEPPVQVANG